jgi:large subunit ribosomal protein L24
MKQKFSTHWISSTQPRKQRKFIANAPLHVRHKFLSANLSKELRKKYAKRNLPLRKGDEVLIMRGAFKKKKAKLTSVDLKKTRVVLEGIQRTKKDGSKVNVFFNPSNLQIQVLNLDDKQRVAALNRKQQVKTEVKSKVMEKK